MMSQEDFLSNLFTLLSTPHYNELLRWNADGTTITISLDKAVCDYYFKQLSIIDGGDVDDFVQRLERSGFMTVKRVKDSITMAHHLLRKGQTLKAWGDILNIKGLEEQQIHEWEELEDLDRIMNQKSMSKEGSRKAEQVELQQEPSSIQYYEQTSQQKLNDLYYDSPPNQLPPIEPPKYSPLIRIQSNPKSSSQGPVVKTEQNSKQSLTEVLGKLKQLTQEAPKVPEPVVSKTPIIEIKEQQPVVQPKQPEPKTYRAKKSCKESVSEVTQQKPQDSKQRQQSVAESQPPNEPPVPLKMYWRDQLYDILEKQRFPEIVSWSANGKLIVVKDQVKLRNLVLGRHLGRSKQFVVFNTQLINHKFKRYYSEMQGQKWYYKFYCHEFLKKGLSRWDWDQFRLSKDEWEKLRFQRKNKSNKELFKTSSRDLKQSRIEQYIEPPKELKRKTEKPPKYFKLLRQQSSSEVKKQPSVVSAQNQPLLTKSYRMESFEPTQKNTYQQPSDNGQLVRIQSKVNDIYSRMDKMEELFTKVMSAIDKLKLPSQTTNEDPNNDTMYIPLEDVNDPLQDSYPRI